MPRPQVVGAGSSPKTPMRKAQIAMAGTTNRAGRVESGTGGFFLAGPTAAFASRFVRRRFGSVAASSRATQDLSRV